MSANDMAVIPIMRPMRRRATRAGIDQAKNGSEHLPLQGGLDTFADVL